MDRSGISCVPVESEQGPRIYCGIIKTPFMGSSEVAGIIASDLAYSSPGVESLAFVIPE